MGRASLLPVCLLALGLAGCAGYKLGPTGGAVAGARSVQINFFQNEAPEPRLTTAVNQALRKRLQQDGTYRLDTHGEGDVLINGVITRYDRSAVTYQPGDIITVRDYALIINAKVTITERGSGRTLLNRMVTGKTTVRIVTDMASTERQALPLLADDLAKNITSLLVDGGW